MAQAINERERFAAALRDCAAQLSAGSGRAPLRTLQRVARSIVEGSSAESSVRTIAFLVDQWITDYYLNFAGDIVAGWEHVEQIRVALLREKTADAIAQLSDAVATGSSDVLKALEALIGSYLKAVDSANRVATESH